jgi:hypothetical protein
LLNLLRQAARELTMPDALGLAVPEAGDHANIITLPVI